ncbi:MAG: flippase-like domain-containing protein [Candidatus Portnoybacteria bacterium]|nr:flippase-like domain-containing protein [Candidatus Portnoybacteria bacterium]
MISFVKKYLPFLGVILFVIILLKFDIGAIIKNLADVRLFYFAAASFLLLPILATKALCWNYIKRVQGIKYSLKDSFLMYSSGIFLGLLTPGRLGEAAKVFYLKKDGHSIGKSMVGIFLDRFSDIIFLFAFVCFGSIFYLSIIKKEILIMLLGLLIIFLLLIASLKTGLARLALKKLFTIFIPERYKKSWNINFHDFISDLKRYGTKNYLVISLITILSWSFYYLEMSLLAKGMGLEVPFLYFTISVTIAGIITFIPISFYGIGTRDAALIILFAPFAIPAAGVIAFSGLILLITFFTALIGFVCWLLKPLKF